MSALRIISQLLFGPNFDSDTHKFVIVYLAPIYTSWLHHPWSYKITALEDSLVFIAERFQQAQLL